MCHYDVNKVLGYVILIFIIQLNNISGNIFENLVATSQDMIKTMQTKNDRKFMFSALCNAIMLGYVIYLYLVRLSNRWKGIYWVF